MMIEETEAVEPGGRATSVPMSAASALETLRSLATRSPLQRRVEALLERTEYRLASTEAELDAVFRHRHDEYVAAGNIARQADRLLHDGNDRGRATRVYTAWVDGVLAGSIRLSILRGASREGLTIGCWPEVVEPMLDDGLTIVDPNRLTTAHRLSRTEPALVFAVLRLATMAARFYGAEHCLTPIRPQHGSFYRRFLHASRIGSARRFPGTAVRMELYDVHVPTAVRRADGGNPFLLERPAESEAIFPPAADLGLLEDVAATA